MTADVELLPLYAELQGHPKLEIVKHYARANVAHATAKLHRQFGCELQDPNGTIWDHAAKLQAEVEALRAEVEQMTNMARMQAARADSAEREARHHKTRAERLAEAGRRVTAAFRAHGEATPFTREAERTRHECESAMLALDAALEQESNDA